MHFVFWQFFNSSTLIHKLFKDGIFAMEAAWSNSKQIPELNEDKRISRGEIDFHYFKNIICCKWYHNKPVLILATNVDGMSWVSNIMRRTKGSATKTRVSCPNIIKFYKNVMGGVEILQTHLFFDLIDVALVNSHIVYTKLGNDISLLNFKIVEAKALVGRYSNCKRLFNTSRSSKQKSHEPSIPRDSQPRCTISWRSEWDSIIARMKAQITKLVCLVRHVVYTYARVKRLFFEVSFVVLAHNYIAYYILSWKWTILV